MRAYIILKISSVWFTTIIIINTTFINNIIIIIMMMPNKIDLALPTDNSSWSEFSAVMHSAHVVRAGDFLAILNRVLPFEAISNFGHFVQFWSFMANFCCFGQVRPFLAKFGPQLHSRWVFICTLNELKNTTNHRTSGPPGPHKGPF